MRDGAKPGGTIQTGAALVNPLRMIVRRAGDRHLTLFNLRPFQHAESLCGHYIAITHLRVIGLLRPSYWPERAGPQADTPTAGGTDCNQGAFVYDPLPPGMRRLRTSEQSAAPVAQQSVNKRPTAYVSDLPWYFWPTTSGNASGAAVARHPAKPPPQTALGSLGAHVVWARLPQVGRGARTSYKGTWAAPISPDRG